MINCMYHTKTGCATVVHDGYRLPDLSRTAVIFTGGEHDISGMTIGGQILVDKGATVFGENVTVDLRSCNRVPARYYRSALPRQSFLRRLFGMAHFDEKKLSDCPYIVRGRSMLKVPGVNVLLSGNLKGVAPAAAFEASILDCSHSVYTSRDGGNPDVRREFNRAMSG